MSKLQLFEYAVLLHPTHDGEKAGEITRIVVEPTHVLAHSMQAVQLIAARRIPNDLGGPEHLSRLEVAARPF